MNTININYMTKGYSALAKSCGAKQGTDKNIADTILEKMNSASDVEETSETAYTGKVSTQDMTMEEYKAYIHDKISQLPMSPSHMMDSIAIHISEAGFEAMKNDPEYEKWVLDGLGKDFMTNNPWSAICGGGYTVHYIGASPEEYRAEGWYAGYQNGKGASLYNDKSSDSFWERKVEREKRLKERYEELQEKKVLAKKWQQERFNAELSAEKVEKSRLMKSWYSESSALRASVAYEANVLTAPAENSGFDSAATGGNA